MTFVRLALEGETDVPIAGRILRLTGCEPFEPIVAHSKSRLDPMIPGLNRSAAGMNWLVLRDFDQDAPCPAALIHRLLDGRSLAARFSLRIAVRSAESWLLADIEAFAAEFAVPSNRVPEHPDMLDDPKQSLVSACRHSKRREIVRAMTPRPRSGRRVGPEYRNRIVTFAETHWNPARAAARSPSLRRAIAAVARLRSEGSWS